MKTLKIILWGINLLFIAYLAHAFATTAPMQNRDYQGVEKGNELFSQIQRQNNFYFYQEHFNYQVKVLKSDGLGEYNSIILNKLLKIKNLTNTYKSRINALSPDNEKNTSKIHSLLTDYAQEIKMMDTSFHRLHSLDWGNLRSIYSKQRLLQKTHSSIFQDDMDRFSQIVAQWSFRGSSVNFVFDKIMLMANEQSRIITEGENYEADLFLCYISKNFFIMHSNLNSGEISVENDVANISIPAQANIFDENGECKKKWKAEITIATAKKNTIYILEREYIVRKKK